LKRKREPKSKNPPHQFGKLHIPKGTRIKAGGLVMKDESEYVEPKDREVGNAKT
jgi:hypothetical protein